MSAVTNPPVRSESKSGKKRRSKPETSESASATPPPEPQSLAPDSVVNGERERVVPDPPFLKELHKALRNANKKLNATAKVDAIIADNLDKSLDVLVEENKINLDQKAQALKKPALRANVAQIEEQIGQYREYGNLYENALAQQKETLVQAHKEELEVQKNTAIAETRSAAEKEFSERLLTFGRFLRAAAAMRNSGVDSPDSRAFEGALFQVYGGTEDAVAAMIKLIDGSEALVPPVEGPQGDVNYARVKQASLDYAPLIEAAVAGENQSVETTPEKSAPATEPVSEPVGQQTNGHHEEPSQPVSAAAQEGSVPENQESHVGGDWVDVKPSEAEEHLDQQAVVGDQSQRAPTLNRGEPADEFEPVVHYPKPPPTGRGGRPYRGRGQRGDYRGRGGFRGDRGGYGRGRGRGEYRGRGRGGHHQAPPPAEPSS